MLKVIPICAFNDNYIWLILQPETRHAAVVDPGDADPVISYCTKHNITIDAILVTHHHGDHTGGITTLAEHYSTTVYGPAQEPIPKCDHPLHEGDSVTLPTLNGLTFDIIDIPGHTSGHIAYYGNNWLFCGDTLFSAGCGRLFEGTPEQMFTSLKKLKSLDLKTKIYCAHEYTLANLLFAQHVEPNNQDIVTHIENCTKLRANNKPTLPSTIEMELKINPFLRAKSEAIFTERRKEKDQF